MKAKVIIIILAFILSACTYDEEKYEEYTFKVTWDPNPEIEVNSYGGGYIVQYAEGINSDIKNIQYVEVPYTGGQQAPTEAIITAKRKVNEDENSSNHVVYSVKVISYAEINGKRVYSAPSQESVVKF